MLYRFDPDALRVVPLGLMLCASLWSLEPSKARRHAVQWSLLDVAAEGMSQGMSSSMQSLAISKRVVPGRRAGLSHSRLARARARVR
jgi:hypothetical protein